MDDDKTKRHVNFTIIAFCGTIMLYMFLAAWLRGGMSHVGIWDYVIAFFVAALAGGATFGAAYVLDP